MENDFTVVVENHKLKIPLRFKEVSTYINGMMSLGFEDDDEIEIQRVSKDTFAEILNFYTMNSFEEVPIKSPINTNQMEEVMDKKNYEFIQKHDLKSEQFKNLYKGAEFLGCKSLLRVCAARFACLIYFEDSKAAFEAKQKQLGVKVKVDFDDNEKFKKLYPFMNN